MQYDLPQFLKRSQDAVTKSMETGKPVNDVFREMAQEEYRQKEKDRQQKIEALLAGINSPTINF